MNVGDEGCEEEGAVAAGMEEMGQLEMASDDGKDCSPKGKEMARGCNHGADCDHDEEAHDDD